MVKVTKVPPAVIPEWWDKIKDAVMLGLPPTMTKDAGTESYILAMLAQDAMQLWLMVNDDKKPLAIGVTQIVQEPGLPVKNLLIFALVSFDHVPMDAWKAGFGVINKFAASEGCKKIIAFTNAQRVVDIATANGAHAEWVVITKEVS